MKPKYIPLVATAAVLLALYAAGCVLFRGFFTLRVAVDVVDNGAFLGVAAIGATFVILAGGIDLSVGAVVACTGILIAALLRPGEEGIHPLIPWLLGGHALPPWAAILIALALGALFGAAMGAIIRYFELPPFLVTLAGMFFARGLGFVVRPQSLGIKHPFYTQTVIDTLTIPLTDDGVAIRFTTMCFAAVFLAALGLAHFTRFGRAVYALGGDEPSALLMGLPVGRTKVLVYTLAGLCSAAAGVVATFAKGAGDPATYVGMELEAIAAVVIGGTLLTGGVGFVAGTVMGVLILSLIQQLITNTSFNTWWTAIAVGLLLLAFISLQNVVSAASRRSRRSGQGSGFRVQGSGKSG